MPCHDFGSQSPASHSGCPGSFPGLSMWNLADEVAQGQILLRLLQVFPAIIHPFYHHRYTETLATDNALHDTVYSIHASHAPIM